MTRQPSSAVRAVIAAAAASVLLTSTVAGAATSAAQKHKHHKKHKQPKPVCDLVVAPKNQAYDTWAPGMPADPALEIVSADVASNASTLTWVIRVKHLSTAPSASAPLGQRYEFKFTVDGTSVDLYDAHSQFGDSTGQYKQYKVTFDTAHNQVRMSVPIKEIESLANVSINQGKTVLSNLFVQTSYEGTTPAASATGLGSLGYSTNAYAEYIGPVASTYLAGTPSCLKVGS